MTDEQPANLESVLQSLMEPLRVRGVISTEEFRALTDTRISQNAVLSTLQLAATRDLIAAVQMLRCDVMSLRGELRKASWNDD